MTDRLLITNVSIARMDAKDSGYGLLCDGALLIDGDRIGWVGRAKDVDPGLVDRIGDKNFRHRKAQNCRGEL